MQYRGKDEDNQIIIKRHICANSHGESGGKIIGRVGERADAGTAGRIPPGCVSVVFVVVVVVVAVEVEPISQQPEQTAKEKTQIEEWITWWGGIHRFENECRR